MSESFTFASAGSATHHPWNGHFSAWHSSQVPTEILSAQWRSLSHVSVRPLLSQPCSSQVREYGLDNTKYPEVIKRFRVIFEQWRNKGSSERATRSHPFGTTLDLRQQRMEKLWRMGSLYASIVSVVLQLVGVTQM